MFSNILSSESDFPRSFRLLQQEAILARSCILTGFEFLVKGGFDDVYKGHYYAAFFHLSIGLERIMKLVVISNHMIKNNFDPIPNNTLKNIGHDLIKLHELSKQIDLDHYSGSSISFIANDSLDYNILIFLNNFAATTGRYYNISNISTATYIDPLIQWQSIIDEIARKDFSESLRNKIELITMQRLIPALQIQDIAFNTGYVNGVYKLHVTNKANHFACWHIMNIIKPIVSILDSISTKCHQIEESSVNSKYPTIPYFDEIFTMVHLNKRDILKKKRWTNF